MSNQPTIAFTYNHSLSPTQNSLNFHELVKGELATHAVIEICMDTYKSGHGFEVIITREQYMIGNMPEWVLLAMRVIQDHHHEREVGLKLSTATEEGIKASVWAINGNRGEEGQVFAMLRDGVVRLQLGKDLDLARDEIRKRVLLQVRTEIVRAIMASRSVMYLAINSELTMLSETFTWDLRSPSLVKEENFDLDRVRRWVREQNEYSAHTVASRHDVCYEDFVAFRDLEKIHTGVTLPTYMILTEDLNTASKIKERVEQNMRKIGFRLYKQIWK